MSILFAYIGNWAKASNSKNLYKLIIASNKDESYSQVVSPVAFWTGSDSHILSPQDQNKDNGTWMGISKQGRFSSVLKIKRDLNRIASEDIQRRKRLRTGKTHISRIALATDYLKTGKSGWDFCKKLCDGPESCKLPHYFPFHCLCVDLLTNTPENTITATYFSNYTCSDINHQDEPKDLTPKVDSCKYLAYGNSPLYKPLRKVVGGRLEFIDIISQYSKDDTGAVISNPENQEALKCDLLEFLRSTERYIPDPVIHELAAQSRVKLKIAHRLSARFVTNYFDIGTRTQTILFVDTNNNVSYLEWQLKEPIYDPETSEWTETVHNFKLEK